MSSQTYEIYQKDDGNMETVFDQLSGYPHLVAKILSDLYPQCPIQIINAGLSGDNVPHALKRLERDVLSCKPDLVVVCFGLNDAMVGLNFLSKYTDALESIFLQLRAQKSEIIFMTPNMMNTGISCHIKDDWFRNYAQTTCTVQQTNTLNTFLDEARKLCTKYDIPICDCYHKWEILYQNGVDITELLANKTNHPSRQMHWLFATSIVETMFTAT